MNSYGLFPKNGVFLSASLSSKRTILQRCSINKTFSFRQTQTTLNHYRLWSFLLGTTAIFLEKSIRNFSKYPLLKISTNTPPFWGQRFEVYCRTRNWIFENFFHFWKSEFTFYSPTIKINSNLEILKLLPFFLNLFVGKNPVRFCPNKTIERFVRPTGMSSPRSLPVYGTSKRGLSRTVNEILI